MRSNGTDRKSGLRSALCLLLAAVTFCLAGTAARADGGVPFPDDPDLILAWDATIRLDLKTPDGSPLTVRSDPSVPGRGKAAPDGSEPDYTGIVGFAAMNRNPAESLFSVFDNAYWTVSNYIIKEGRHVKVGLIPHKTPVMVVSQTLEPDGNGNYTGYLEAVRLDTASMCMLDANSFVTLDYWKLPAGEIASYGYCIAVYRETPGEGPRDEDGKACPLRDGTRVLLPAEGDVPANNPNPEHLSVQGIIFLEGGDGTMLEKTVYFRESDLITIY